MEPRPERGVGHAVLICPLVGVVGAASDDALFHAFNETGSSIERGLECFAE